MIALYSTMQAHGLSADHAILLLTLGVLLIYVELNRPGWVVPGAMGLLAVLLSAAALLHDGLSRDGAFFCVTAAALLATGLRRSLRPLVAVAATLVLTLGLDRIDPHVHADVAVPCGVLLGASTWALTRIARRARVNKGLD